MVEAASVVHDYRQRHGMAGKAPEERVHARRVQDAKQEQVLLANLGVLVQATAACLAKLILQVLDAELMVFFPVTSFPVPAAPHPPVTSFWWASPRGYLPTASARSRARIRGVNSDRMALTSRQRQRLRARVRS